jgi:hypothetical protein
MLAPPLPHGFDSFGLGECPILLGREAVRLARIKRPVGYHDVRVWLLFAVTGTRFMDGDIRHNAPAGELFADEGPHRFNTLFVVQFPRQSNQNFPRRHCVFSLLGCVDVVPQRFAVFGPLWRVFRCDDFRVFDAFLALVAMRQFLAFVVELFGMTIGGSGDT